MALSLPPMPSRIALLPRDERGYPIPFFVPMVDGKPEFRFADPAKLPICVKEKRCWICGDRLGAYKAFVFGPISTITRVTSEPPSHTECAKFAVKACPFLVEPRRKRDPNEPDAGRAIAPSGLIERNPGVAIVWVTRRYWLFSPKEGGQLIGVGEPEAVHWYREGRPATREEVVESVESGFPLLLELGQKQNPDVDVEQIKAEVKAKYERMQYLIPAE